MNIKVAAFTVSEKSSNKPDTFSEEADFMSMAYVSLLRNTFASRDIRQPTMWLCVTRFPIRLGISSGWSEYSLSAWRKCGSLITNCAHSQDSDHMRGSRTFCQRGSNFDNVFVLVDEERGDPSTTISGPLTACQRNADDGPTLNAGLVAAVFQGIRTCIVRKSLIFVFFQGGGVSGSPVPPPDPHMDQAGWLIRHIWLFALRTFSVLVTSCHGSNAYVT